MKIYNFAIIVLVLSSSHADIAFTTNQDANFPGTTNLVTNAPVTAVINGECIYTTLLNIESYPVQKLLNYSVSVLYPYVKLYFEIGHKTLDSISGPILQIYINGELVENFTSYLLYNKERYVNLCYRTDPITEQEYTIQDSYSISSFTHYLILPVGTYSMNLTIVPAANLSTSKFGLTGLSLIGFNFTSQIMDVGFSDLMYRKSLWTTSK